MMNTSLNVSKSAIKAQQQALDAISHNIANATTEGYKAKNVRFQTLVMNEFSNRHIEDTPVVPITSGVRSEVAGTDFTNGNLRQGATAYDLSAVEGGFFGVQNAEGEFYLTRDGSFSVDGTGQLVNANGDYLVVSGATPLNIPTGADITIEMDGAVYNQVNGERILLGTIQVFEPNNVQALQAVGNNYYAVPADQVAIRPGANLIEVSYLEQSNVDLAKELTDMIVAQRAYDLNIRVAQSADELESITNQF